MIQISPNPSLDPHKVDTAILFAGWSKPFLGKPAELLPLLGTPVLQLAMERLARAGCKTIHVILGSNPQPIRSFLGDGARWGCRLSHHLPKDGERFRQVMRRLGLNPEQSYILADATQLPEEEELPAVGAPSTVGMGIAYIWQQDRVPRWSGWGIFSGAWLTALDTDNAHAPVEACLLASQDIVKQSLAQPLSAATPAALLQSNRRLLADRTEAPSPGRGGSIAASARILPPVYIGRHVKIAAEAVVGPNVVLADGAFVDRDAHLRDTVILPHTYVGEGLQLHDSLANGSLLANVRLDTMVEVVDTDLLCFQPQADRSTTVAPVGERILAFLLYTALAPLNALVGLQRERKASSPFIPSKGTSTLPRAGQAEPMEIRVAFANPRGQSASISHFRHTFYPGLKEVMQGRVALVGPTPRSLAEVRQLDEPWRTLYEENRCGLVNESLLQGNTGVAPELEFAGDALAGACRDNPRARRKLLRRYLGAVIRDLWRQATSFRNTDSDVPHQAASRTSPITETFSRRQS